MSMLILCSWQNFFIAQAWGSSHHFQVAVAISSLPLHHHTQVVAPSGSSFLINTCLTNWRAFKNKTIINVDYIMAGSVTVTVGWCFKFLSQSVLQIFEDTAHVWRYGGCACQSAQLFPLTPACPWQCIHRSNQRWMLNIATCLSRLPIPLFTFAASLANRLGHWYVMYGLTVISWLSLLEVHEMMFNLITAIAVKFLGWKKMFSMITVPNIGVCLWSYISNLYTVVTTLCPKWHFDQLLC